MPKLNEDPTIKASGERTNKRTEEEQIIAPLVEQQRRKCNFPFPPEPDLIREDWRECRDRREARRKAKNPRSVIKL